MWMWVAAAAGVLAIVGIGLLNSSLGRHDVAVVTATPTPGANSGAAGVQLVDGTAVGAPAYAQGDTPQGGSGAPVDGVGCQAMEGAVVHVHAHLALFENGKQLQLPAQVGIVPSSQPPCLYWLHTHDASGIIHVESPEARAFTLGTFFDIWGQPLTRTAAAGMHGPLHVFLNGSPYGGDPRTIPLTAHQQIAIEAGSPVVPPPRYVFPNGE